MADEIIIETWTVTLGRRLRETRESLGLTEHDISDQLRLPLDTIRHLESGTGDHVTMRPYLRGYIQNYGRVIGIPAEDIQHLLQELRGSSLKNTVEPVKGVLSEEGGMKPRTLFIVGAILLCFLGGCVLSWCSLNSSRATREIESTPSSLAAGDRAEPNGIRIEEVSGLR